MQWALFHCWARLVANAFFSQSNSILRAPASMLLLNWRPGFTSALISILVYRPDWIQAWESGRNATNNDGWQAELWRRLRHTLKAEHWVDLHQRVLRELAGEGVPPDLLPKRISLFGIPALSSGYLSLLQQLSGWMDIHLFLLNPCEKHWSGIVDATERSGRELAGESAALYLETEIPCWLRLVARAGTFWPLY